MSIFRRRHPKLDARVAEARKRAQEAAAEAELSQARQEQVRERVIRPLRKAGEHNQFAELIRASLIEGHQKGA